MGTGRVTGALGAGSGSGTDDGLPVLGEIRIAPDPAVGGKLRPAVVVWTDDDSGQAGIRFVFGTASAVSREGRGRRLVDWRAAGLPKAALVEDDESVRRYDDLSERKGRVSERDLRRILG